MRIQRHHFPRAPGDQVAITFGYCKSYVVAPRYVIAHILKPTVGQSYKQVNSCDLWCIPMLRCLRLGLARKILIRVMSEIVEYETSKAVSFFRDAKDSRNSVAPLSLKSAKLTLSNVRVLVIKVLYPKKTLTCYIYTHTDTLSQRYRKYAAIVKRYVGQTILTRR